MKILYIRSSYGQIYRYLERFILQALQALNVKYLDIHPLEEIEMMKNKVESFQPDAAIALVGYSVPSSFIHWLRGKKIKTAVWLTEDPYYTDRSLKLLPSFDIIHSISKQSVEYYKELGFKKVFHTALGTDLKTYYKRPMQKYEADICLVGYPYKERENFVNRLLTETTYSLTLAGDWQKRFPTIVNNKRVKLFKWQKPQIVASLYSSAKIVINLHRSALHDFNENSANIMNTSINNRTFDIAACSAFQLIDWQEDLPLYFTPYEEIVAYHSMDQLFQLIDYYLQHPHLRKTIAQNGQKRVIHEHTFLHRIKKLLEQLD